MNKVILYLKKEQNIIGSMIYDEKSRGILGSALIRVDYLIENYNRNLIGLDIPNEIFVLRFFEKNNYTGEFATVIPETMIDSFRYLKKNFPHHDFYREKQDPKLGKISILSKTYDFKAGDVDIVINLDERKLEIKGGVKEISYIDYLDIKKHVTPKDIPRTEINLKNPHFNQINELTSFVWHNSTGFTYTESHKIFICM